MNKKNYRTIAITQKNNSILSFLDAIASREPALLVGWLVSFLKIPSSSCFLVVKMLVKHVGVFHHALKWIPTHFKLVLSSSIQFKPTNFTMLCNK